MATAAGLLDLTAGDPAATRTVYAIVVALGVIGVSLVALAVWLIRQTRPERELLAPLELMGDRGWRSQDPAQMRRALDEVRPPGAEPVTRQPGRPALDEEFEQPVPSLGRFDDLRDVPPAAPLDDEADDAALAVDAESPDEAAPAVADNVADNDADTDTSDRVGEDADNDTDNGDARGDDDGGDEGSGRDGAADRRVEANAAAGSDPSDDE